MKRSHIVVLVILLVLILDQALKIYIKTNFEFYRGFNILGLEWARIHFIENDGMAFGISLGQSWGKLFLSVFRIAMVGFLIWLIRKMIQEKESIGLLISFSLIIAGAIGNILDSAFYGILFSKSGIHTVAEFLPEAGGYAPFLYGHVVDMLYFPLLDTHWPEWFPFFGGQRFQFFKPIFNIADSSITIGVLSIFLFHRKLFRQKN